MILARYITKEVILNFLVITMILLFVALSNKFVSLLAKVAIGQLPSQLLLRVMWLYVPELLASLAPLGFFIAVLFAYGRLHADSEMAVLFTSGVDWTVITKFVIRLAVVIAIGIFYLTTWLMPKIAKTRDQVLSQGEAVGVMQSIVPGQFQMFDGGRLVFYVEDLQKDQAGSLKNIFIAEQIADHVNKDFSLITAANGYLELKDGVDGQDFFLVLKNGCRYTGRPGDLNYRVMEFAEYGRGVEQSTPTANVATAELISTKALFFSDNLADIAELQWRLALPLSVLVLGLLAVPLAKVRPRQGRFAKFLPAILLYIAYFNLMILTRRWVAAGVLPAYCGIWVVHFAWFLLGSLLLAQASGRMMQIYQVYRRKYANH